MSTYLSALLCRSISDNQSLVYPVAQVSSHDARIKKFKCENARKRLFENYEIEKLEEHIRLKPLQYRRLSVSEKSEYYTKWVSENDYLVFQDQDGRIFSVIASKRGNDVYIKKIDEKFKIFKNKKLASGISLYDKIEEIDTDLLFITLTESTRKNSVDEAWKSIGKKLNLFLSKLIKKYGRVVFFRSFESHKSGYPHIHVLIKFLDYRFNVIKHIGTKDGEKSWRLKNEIFVNKFQSKNKRKYKKELEKKTVRQVMKNCWNYGYLDVKGCTSVKEALGYVGKYVLKSAVGDPKENLTLALNWYFGKRAFSVSKNFFSVLIKEMCNSNQITNSNYTFLGVLPSSFIRPFVLNQDAFDRGKWKNNVSPNIVDAIRESDADKKIEEDFQNSIPKRVTFERCYSYSKNYKKITCVDVIDFNGINDYGDDIELRPTNLLKVDYSVEQKIIEEMQLQDYFSRSKN